MEIPQKTIKDITIEFFKKRRVIKIKIMAVTDNSVQSSHAVMSLVDGARKLENIEIIFAHLSMNITESSKKRGEVYVSLAQKKDIKASVDMVTYDTLRNGCMYICHLAKEHQVSSIFMPSSLSEVKHHLSELCSEIPFEIIRIAPTLKDLMTKDIITVSPDINVQEASILMTNKKIGCLIVVVGGNAIGIVTESDLISRVLALGKDPRKVRLKDIMTSPVISLDSSIDLSDATGMMAIKKIKKVLVTENDKIVGIVSVGDLAIRHPDIAGEITENISKME